MKKIVSLVLAISMVFSMFVSAFAATKELSDIADTKYAGSVEALVELGVINGMPDGTFKPAQEVTRAELAKMLVVCLGLGDTVDALKGRTVFTDVSDGHWASGYINAAVQSKVIAGYPDGTFKPEKNVTYAEAVTMVIRALGYGNVVDQEGTWPTAYMLKAVELELLDDMGSPKSGEPATRGNTAILLWNMLRTPMWKIYEESEGNGMTSTARDDEMLNVKFPNYAFADDAIFDGYEIVEEDDKATVKLYFKTTDSLENARKGYTYAEDDFFKFVPGTEVEVLVNEKEETVLSMVDSGEDKLVDGEKDKVDGDYDELQDEEYDYAYTKVKGKKVTDAVLVATESLYVDKLEEKSDYIRVNGETKLKDDDYDYALILKDGERVTLDELEVDDILTTVKVTYFDGTDTEERDAFYVIGSEEVEGELKRYAEVDYDNSELTFEQLTLGKDKYVVDSKATFVEDPEAKTIKDEVLTEKYDSKMKGEEVVVYLDAVYGKVVRIHFDGKIDSGDEESTDVKFFAVTEGVDKDGKIYTIGLANADGEDTYEFAKSSNAESEAKSAYANGDDATGAFVAVELDDEGKIVEYNLVASFDGKVEYTEDTLVYGEEADNEFFNMTTIESGATYDKDNKAITDGADVSVKVNASTVLVKVVYDDKGTNKTSDDEYRVEFVKGLDAVKKVDDETDPVLVITDAADDFERAKYVVVFRESSDKSENRVAKVVSVKENTKVGDIIIKLEEDGDEVSYVLSDDLTEDDVKDFAAVVYTITVNSKDEEIFNLVTGIKESELLESYDRHEYIGVVSEDGRAYKNAADEEVDLDSDENTEKYEDCMVVVLHVSVDEDDETEDQYVVDSVEYGETTYAEVALEEGDRVTVDEDEEVFCIIRGMPVKE